MRQAGKQQQLKHTVQADLDGALIAEVAAPRVLAPCTDTLVDIQSAAPRGTKGGSERAQVAAGARPRRVAALAAAGLDVQRAVALAGVL